MRNVSLNERLSGALASETFDQIIMVATLGWDVFRSSPDYPILQLRRRLQPQVGYPGTKQQKCILKFAGNLSPASVVTLVRSVNSAPAPRVRTVSRRPSSRLSSQRTVCSARFFSSSDTRFEENFGHAASAANGQAFPFNDHG